MSKKLLTFITFVILTVTLTLMLSGCGGEDDLFEGKYIVTFELNGGTLDFKTSSVNTNIKYAYEPDTYVIDVSEIDGYKLFKEGYVFTGWYTSESCLPEQKWDFDNRTVDTEELVLFAGWEKAIVYSYTLYYVDGDDDVELGSYPVKAGAAFSDWRKFAQARVGYTPIGFFSDRECTTPWNAQTVHPGGDADMDIPVYVNYIEGDWTLVGDISSLENAISNNKNVYLTSDIDCAMEELSLGSYTGTFEGNGYAVSNFTVKKSSSLRTPSCSIFDTLGSGTVLKNVSFVNVAYDMTGINLSVIREVRFAALAITAEDVTLSNVSVSGTVTTNYAQELTRMNEAFFVESGTVTAENVSIAVTSVVTD